MKTKKIHYIHFARFACSVCPPEYTHNKFTGKEECITFGWKTLCGDIFWPHWEGTTEVENVTCKKCIRNLSKLLKTIRTKNESD